MVIPEIETTFSNYLDQIEDKEENKESPKLREEFHALTEPVVEFRRDLLFVVMMASAAALVPPESVIRISLAMLDADILIGASICHVLLVFHI